MTLKHIAAETGYHESTISRVTNGKFLICPRGTLSMPALATLGIIQFMWSWNDFLWPLIIIDSASHAPLQLGLSSLQGAHSTEWNLLMAGPVMSQIPMLAIFLLAQRWFIRSIAFTGIK